jgi:hypothetical protein
MRRRLNEIAPPGQLNRSVATFSMNDERHRSLIKQLIANARAIISYQVGLPFGCVRMRRIIDWLKPYEVLEFPVFDRYAAATLDLPTSSERLQCSREALRRYDERLTAINLEYREEILDTCFGIIERFANRNGEPAES